MIFKNFEIRKFRLSDIEQIVTLFYETVHSVNKRIILSCSLMPGQIALTGKPGRMPGKNR